MSNKKIKVYRDLMGENQKWATKTRELLKNKNISMYNFIGSPGAGKTSLLEKLSDLLKDTINFAVLEGDIATTKDAERLDNKNIPVSQLLTNGSCHLEAKLIHYALLDFPIDTLDMVIIENVGNLVCPAEFDVGEDLKIAVLSVTEGEEKPLKYPLLFTEAKAIVVTKTDLLPHIPFDMNLCIDNIKKINPNIPIFPVSVVHNTGMSEWVYWLKELTKK